MGAWTTCRGAVAVLVAVVAGAMLQSSAWAGSELVLLADQNRQRVEIDLSPEFQNDPTPGVNSWLFRGTNVLEKQAYFIRLGDNGGETPLSNFFVDANQPAGNVAIANYGNTIEAQAIYNLQDPSGSSLVSILNESLTIQTGEYEGALSVFVFTDLAEVFFSGVAFGYDAFARSRDRELVFSYEVDVTEGEDMFDFVERAGVGPSDELIDMLFDGDPTNFAFGGSLVADLAFVQQFVFDVEAGRTIRIEGTKAVSVPTPAVATAGIAVLVGLGLCRRRGKALL